MYQYHGKLWYPAVMKKRGYFRSSMVRFSHVKVICKPSVECVCMVKQIEQDKRPDGR